MKILMFPKFQELKKLGQGSDEEKCSEEESYDLTSEDYALKKEEHPCMKYIKSMK